MNRTSQVEGLLEKLNKKKIWDEEPVFCFTTDIDWASESVLGRFFDEFPATELKLTAFLTHASAITEEWTKHKKLGYGIHPNFLPGSSHGHDYRTVIETCLQFAAGACCFRSHRFFDVTDITHLLHDEFNFRYCSNYGTIFQKAISPILHESGLVNIPVYFEDGTYLFNKLDMNIRKYENYLQAPGIKVISFHPTNFVINPPELRYMRSIKDALSREAYNNLDEKAIERLRFRGDGIRKICDDLVEIARRHPILSLQEIYELATD